MSVQNFANIGESTKETAIEMKVLASNPIMEVKYSFHCILLDQFGCLGHKKSTFTT